MSNTKNQGPFFNIGQPFSRNHTNQNMQEIFRIKIDAEPEAEEEENLSTEENKKIVTNANRGAESLDAKTEKKNSASSIPPEHNRSAFKRVKPFKEMSVKERLEYLINFPKVLPPVPCVFYTKDEKHLGYLTSYEDNQITIQYHNKMQKTFYADEITNVIMIGIKR
ncbi:MULTISPECIES: CotO family spore coat protein [Neobacillus]|uniref:Spore coat protein CotO n=1 Tax=Neobacillus rhizophilus TaxID=2833579 RepID=A0A942U3I9_9BACI|nr:MULTISPECIES: CotO family spore coat protein [Neobacillus]MBS4212123.1 hypothetical protein [Neobacillus rhizophilus]MBU8915553.1 spore coat CotO family protein [Bacillus sp. FJAT-29953]